MPKAPGAPTATKPTVVAAERAGSLPDPAALVEESGFEPIKVPEIDAQPEPKPEPVFVDEAPEQELDEPLEFESPDVTTRYAVAQLTELNKQLEKLTVLTADRTEAALEKVSSELRRITSLREVDLTEQAAGIFGAVQAGADALSAFATVVTELTTDLKTILSESLEAIGGTEGLAAWVAESATELTDIREEFVTSLNRIERDLAVLRKRSNEPAEAVGINLNDDQLTFIVEAVTEAVVTALQPGTPARTMRGRR
jgi:hypothetical protein